MTNLEKFYDFINNKSIALLGLGISNSPLVDLLLSHGARVSAHDKKKREDFSGTFISDLEKKGVRLFLGDGYLDSLDEDIIIKAPGIRNDIPALVNAVERKAVLTSEMEIFFSVCDCEKLAVTGSDGKTTTTTLTHLMLTEHYKNQNRHIYVGGNIGRPLLPLADEMSDADIAVIELSSFQLHAMKASPNGVIVTNVSPNHLDWHTDYDEYIESKKRILRFMKSGVAVLNYNNEITRNMAKDVPQNCKVRFFTSGDAGNIPDLYTCVYCDDGKIYVWDAELARRVHIMDTTDILLPGVHNVENYMAAIALLYGKVDTCVFKKVATTFGGVEHRIELVREKNGVKYYNSSIDSSPTRTMSALNAFGEKKVIAIMGGYDKNIPYEAMGGCVREHTKTLVLTGATAEKIRAAVTDCSSSYALPEIHMVDDFTEAVITASRLACPGDIVILTPASASFDKFKNFEQRGNLFKEIVRAL